MLCLHAQASEAILLGIQWFLSLFGLLLYVFLWGFGSSEIAVQLRRFLGAAVVATFLSVPLMVAIYRWQDTLTQRRAATLIQQIDTFQKQHGHYPESLEELVPRQLPKVPATAHGLLYGRPFSYKTYYDQSESATALAGQGYALRYYLGTLVEASYNSGSRKWHYDD